jgi:DNA-binding MarR family transcriptional regulator
MGHKSGHEPGKGQSDQDMTDLTLRTVMRGTRFIRQIMGPFFASMGISISQWVVMRAMLTRERETGKPVRLVDLSSFLMIRQPTLTAAINKLVLLGLVERVSPERNRRGRLVRLSPQGRDHMTRILEHHRGKTRELFSVWDKNDKALIIELFERLENHLLHYLPQDPERHSRPYGHKSASPRGEL